MEAEPLTVGDDAKAGVRGHAAPIIERAPLPIVEVQGSSHVISSVNQSFCKLIQKTKAELLGVPFCDVVPGAEGCLPVLDAVYKTGTGLTHAHEDTSGAEPSQWLYAMWPALDGSARPVGVIIQLTKASTLKTPTAISEALLISAVRQHELTEAAEKLAAQLQREINERKLAEAALREARDRLADQAASLEHTVAERTEKLRETVGELESFSYSVAHDLRAPLRAVQGYSDFLLEDYADKIDETGRTYLERMSRSVLRMDKLIQDVLSYTSILNSDVPMEAVALDTLVRDIIAAYPEWQPPNAVVQIEVKLPNVFGNEALVSQCFFNVLSNALKFVSPGTQPRVRIWPETVGGRVRVWVEDNGVGIAPQHHARIFRMFERIYGADEYAGTGIGLTIVRKAAHRMGGEVGLESQLGTGSRFWIDFQATI